MNGFRCVITAILLIASGDAYAQTTDTSLDQDCPIPYTAARQELLVEAYVDLTAKIAGAFPEGTPSAAALNGYYSEIRRILSGEAVQGFHKVAEAYACRLRKKLPTNKQAYINAVLGEVKLATAAAMLPGNFENPTNLTLAYTWAEERVASPPAAFTSTPPTDRLTSAEILGVLGAPNFTSANATRYGIEAKFGGSGAGVCVGTVRASLSTFDNATLVGLGDLAQIFANMADEAYRPGAYSQLLTHAQGVMAPGASTQIGIQINAAGNKSALRTCLRDGAAALTTLSAPVSTPTGSASSGTAH